MSGNVVRNIVVNRSAIKTWVCVISCIFWFGQSILATPVIAGPLGGEVMGDSGSISQTGLTTTITQTSQNMAIDWQSYNVAVDERVHYIQPNAASISLNRILSQNGSTIAGRIDANGQVILVNPNGIFFAPTSVLNVGGIIASGLNIQPTDFMNGNYIFDEVLGAEGKVINSGIINASLGGNVALIGKQVENDGLIVANLGSVSLAAGKQAILTFDDAGVLGVRISKEILQEELGVDPAVINSGDIQAEGGRVLLAASTSQDVFSQAVNTNSLDPATSVVVHEDGSFTLGGGADVLNTGSIDISATSSDQAIGRIVLIGENVTSSGELYADAANGNGGEIELHAMDTALLAEHSMTSARAESNGQGGIVKVLGDKVGLFDQAMVDVSGANGGGQVLVGGDYQGSNANIRNATATVVGREATITADALDQGNGGKVILWSDMNTFFWGSAFSRGGSLSGNGGLIETSGLMNLLFDGIVDLYAENGANGLLLLDPRDINIVSGNAEDATDNNLELSAGDLNVFFAESSDSNFDITANRIELILGSGNVLLEARRDINIDSAIAVSENSNNLTMLAGDDISINANISIHSGDLLMISGSASCKSNCSPNGGRVDSGGGLNGRNVYIDGALTTTGSIGLYAADHVIVDEVVTTGSLTIRAGNSILINASNNDNVIEPNATSNNGEIRASGNVSLTAADATLQTDQITFDTGSGPATTGITVAPVPSLLPTGVIEVEGDVSISGGDFAATTIGSFKNWFNSQNLNVGSGSVSIVADEGASLGDITAGSLSVTTTGEITQSSVAARNLVISGVSSFSSAGYSIILQNAWNNLAGEISLSTTGANDIGLVNAAATTILGAISVGGNLTVTASGNLAITDANIGADDVVGVAGSMINFSFGTKDDVSYTFTADGTIGAAESISVSGNSKGSSFNINAASELNLIGGMGDDNFNIDATVCSVNAGDGVDTITINSLGGVSSTILTGKGNDVVTVAGSATSIDSGSGDDVINVDGSVSSINAGDGENQVTVLSGGSLSGAIITGKDNDSVSVAGSAASINTYAGKDAITVSGTVSGAINGGAEDDSFTVSGNGTISGIVSGDAGNDELSIVLDSGARSDSGQITFIGGEGDDVITVTGTSGAYSEDYKAYQGAYDQLIYSNSTATFSLNYNGVKAVHDNIETTSLTINSSSAQESIQLWDNMFNVSSSTNTGSLVNVSVTPQSKGSILVQAQSDDYFLLLDDITINGDLSITSAIVSDTGSTINASGLILDGVNQSTTAAARVNTNVAELTVRNHAGSLYINEANDINIVEINDTSGAIDIMAAGAISSAESASLVTNGSLNLESAGGISLLGENQFTNTLTLKGQSVDINNVGEINIVDVTASRLSLSSGSDINVTTASGDINVGVISSDTFISIKASDGAIVSNGSLLTAPEVELRATSGIGVGSVDYNEGFSDPSFAGAINTRTSTLSAINNSVSPGSSAISINNKGELLVQDLRTDGDILLQNDADIIFDIGSDNADLGVAETRTETEDGVAWNPDFDIGAIDANYGHNVADTPYAGSVAIRGSDNQNPISIYTLGTGESGIDIVAQNLLVANVAEFGSPHGVYPNPIRLRVVKQFSLFSALNINGRGYVGFIDGRPERVQTTADLLERGGVITLAGQQLIDVESLADINPAIFTEVRNYNYDDIAILLPNGQIIYGNDDEEREEQAALLQ